MSYDNVRIGEWILSSDINKPDSSFIDPNEEGKTFNVSDYPELAKVKTEWVSEDTITIPDNEIPIDKTVKNYYTMLMTAKTYAAGLYLAKNSYVHNAGIIYKVNQNLKTTNWADDSNYFTEIAAENYKYYAIYYVANIPLAKDSYVSYNGRFYKLNETIAKTTNWATDSLKMSQDPSFDEYKVKTNQTITYDGKRYKALEDIDMTVNWSEDSSKFEEVEMNDLQYSIAITGKKPYLRAKNLLSLPLSEKIFPVGYIFISMVDKNPGEYFGGTWIKITAGKFLVNVDPNDEKIDTSGKEGGLITKQLSVKEMPKHSHKFRHFKLQFPKDKPIADKIAGYDLKHFAFDNDVETDTTGEGEPFDIRPNYFACYMFQKIE